MNSNSKRSKDDEVRAYAHFDKRVSYSKVRRQVENPEWVKQHGFFPLISKTVRNKKYDGTKVEEKNRHVAYASHIDRCVYQRYSLLLNNIYNAKASALGINEVAIAYRTNLHRSNIDFAFQAFSTIENYEKCWILVADFKDFFPSLDHAILKHHLRLLFDKSVIPDDYFRVFKSVIHWSQWDIKNILSLRGLDPGKEGSIRKLNSFKLALERKDFKENVRDAVEKPWASTDGGIPQGLPISGILANVFMMGFDKELNDVASGHNGLYMRYSDDVIMILPTQDSYRECNETLSRLCKKNRLIIEPDKTIRYISDNSQIYRCDSSGAEVVGSSPTKLQYLGFDFDGTEVRLRQRTVGRYYRKMHRKVTSMFKGSETPSKKRMQGLYTRYTNKGRHAKGGNFISYARRAEEQCVDYKLSSGIDADICRHYLKLRRETQKAIESAPTND